jgi:hypothetical protein
MIMTTFNKAGSKKVRTIGLTKLAISAKATVEQDALPANNFDVTASKLRLAEDVLAAACNSPWLDKAPSRAVAMERLTEELRLYLTQPRFDHLSLQMEHEKLKQEHEALKRSHISLKGAFTKQQKKSEAAK